MPPQENSRYLYSSFFADECDNIFIGYPPNFKEQLEDVEGQNITVGDGDTLQSIAATFWPELTDPQTLQSSAQFWWIIAYANDIVDATQELEAGTSIFVPNLEVVIQDILTRPAGINQGVIQDA